MDAEYRIEDPADSLFSHCSRHNIDGACLHGIYGGRMGLTLLEPHAQELVYQLGGKKVWSLVRAVGA